MLRKFLLILIVIAGLFLMSSGIIYAKNKISTKKTFKEIGREYNNVLFLSEVGGKLAYIASKGDKHVVVFNGVEGKEYDGIGLNQTGSKSNFVTVGRKIAYVANERINNEWKEFIVFNGKEFGKEEGNIFTFVNINGKLVYVAGTPDHWKVFVEGVPLKYEYSSDSPIIAIGDKIVYVAEEPLAGDTSGYGKVHSFISFDGQKIGSEYDEVSSPTNVGGKLAYIAKTSYAAKIGGIVETGKSSFVVFDGKAGKPYNKGNINEIFNIGGKPIYIVEAISYGKLYDCLVSVNGEECYYENIQNLINVNDKLAYIAVDNNTSNKFYVVVYDNKIVSKKYDSISNLINVKGKLAYIATEGKEYTEGRESFVVFDGIEGKHYKEVLMLTNINGKLAYLAREKDGKSFVVLNGIEGKRYENIYNLINVKGKLVYQAANEHIAETYNDWKWFIVYNGKEIGKEYYSAEDPINVGGKLVYTAKVQEKILLTPEQQIKMSTFGLTKSFVEGTKSFVVMEK